MPGREVLHGVTTSFPENKVTTIIGPNGCGKSTLLKICADILTPSSGSVTLDDVDIRTFKPKELARKIAILSQKELALDETVYELVSYGRYPHQRYGAGLSPLDKERIESAMETTHVAEFRNRMLSQLSGGQRQRVYIAMAIAQDTGIILLDEPTTYMDISVRFEIMELVRSLQQSGKTIVMVLHDIDLALDYSDHILVMKDGNLVLEGTSEDIIASRKIDEVFNVRMSILDHDERQIYHFDKR
jgi:iron complex transport system ATP-binding protein